MPVQAIPSPKYPWLQTRTNSSPLLAQVALRSQSIWHVVGGNVRGVGEGVGVGVRVGVGVGVGVEVGVEVGEREWGVRVVGVWELELGVKLGLVVV